MTVEAVESRIAQIQASISALANGTAPTATSSGTSTASGMSFSDVLVAQNASISTLMDAAGTPQSTDLSSLLGGDTTSSVSDLLDNLQNSLPTTSTGPTGADVVADAKKYLGVAYRWGGTNPATGLDCSGLVQRVMKDLGVTMPRTVSEQRNEGTKVTSLADAKPGDLLVFGTHHIGIYVGDGKMLHAPHTGDHVRISSVYETPTQIRRVLPSSDGQTYSPQTSAITDLRPSSLRSTSSTGTTGSTAFDSLFATATSKYDLPAGLLKAVASVESSFNPQAVSGAGAEGLMQLMPGTARSLGVNPMNPTQAVNGAAHLLSGLIDQFGSVKLALAAYNAGAGAVKKYGGVPPYAETQNYVKRVMSRMEG